MTHRSVVPRVLDKLGAGPAGDVGIHCAEAVRRTLSPCIELVVKFARSVSSASATTNPRKTYIMHVRCKHGTLRRTPAAQQIEIFVFNDQLPMTISTTKFVEHLPRSLACLLLMFVRYLDIA